MKIVKDINGNIIEVPDSTPVRTKDGTHYLLTSQDEVEEAQKEAEFQLHKSERKKEILKRKYGSLEEQFEYLVEHGIDALKARRALIKKNHEEELA